MATGDIEIQYPFVFVENPKEYWEKYLFAPAYVPADGNIYGIMDNDFVIIPSGGGIGIKLNTSVIGGVKRFISLTDELEIPLDWQYNVVSYLDIEGIVINEGEINII